MLVLSRKVGQKVVAQIGSTEVEVSVVKVSGEKIRLGFDAPKEVSILRGELQNTGVNSEVNTK